MADTETAVGTMGNTGTINITSQMMKDAMQAITDYKDAIKTAYSLLEKEMGTISGNFVGAAANGFNKFYTDSIVPMLKENGNLSKMLDSLYQICESALKQLPGEEGVDENLAKINNPGAADGAGAGAAAGVATAADGAGE